MTKNIFAIFGFFRKLLWFLEAVDHFKVVNNALIRKCGFNEEKIELNNVNKWSIIPEMTFDVVVFEFFSGSTKNWIDSDGELTALLRDHIPNKEKQRGRESFSAQPWEFAP